jgi:DNA-binding helix-turn-helix protein|nr:MAG TPA: regulatory protein [Caudoviricetes sp.]
MGIGGTKDNQNVYFRARKEAAEYNEALSSREKAAELLGISSSTLADYELGITKFVPVDKVVLMSDLYNRPELRTGYCKHECPIGKNFSIATRINGIEGIALRIIREFNSDKIKGIKEMLVDIAADGVISEDEKPVLKEILEQLDQLSLAISELKLAGEKALKG